MNDMGDNIEPAEDPGPIEIGYEGGVSDREWFWMCKVPFFIFAAAYMALIIWLLFPEVHS